MIYIFLTQLTFLFLPTSVYKYSQFFFILIEIFSPPVPLCPRSCLWVTLVESISGLTWQSICFLLSIKKDLCVPYFSLHNLAEQTTSIKKCSLPTVWWGVTLLSPQVVVWTRASAELLNVELASCDYFHTAKGKHCQQFKRSHEETTKVGVRWEV